MRETRILKQPWTPPPRRLVLLIVALFILLNACDTAATLILSSADGNTLEEQIPTMRWALNAGPCVFISVKMGVAVVTSSMLGWFTLRNKKRFSWRALCVFTFILAAIVIRYLVVFIIRPPPGF